VPFKLTLKQISTFNAIICILYKVELADYSDSTLTQLLKYHSHKMACARPIPQQGLPGDGHDRAGTRKRPQNNPWGVVNSTRKKKIKLKKNSLHFIHFQLQNIAPICLQIPSNVKVTLGKSFLALKHLIYAMQNSPCGNNPRPTGVI
jgi:hypothetical protein